MYIIMFIELVLILPFMISYAGLAEHIYEYKRLAPATRHIYRFGQPIRWWYFLPFSYLFSKNL